MQPVVVAVPLAEADQSRLYVTDANDGINSDNGAWALARLK